MHFYYCFRKKNGKRHDLRAEDVQKTFSGGYPENVKISDSEFLNDNSINN